MAAEDVRRLEATIEGRVQGVGFRYFVQRRAEALGLRGFVRNLRGGAVELVAEGPEMDLHRLLREVREGPPHAHVLKVEERWREARGEPDGFRVEYTV